jgi:pimeloyl-ACP methyl ester carboxylesterase
MPEQSRFRDIELEIPLDGQTYPGIIREPLALAEKPALIVFLTLVGNQGFEQEPFCKIPHVMTAAGHRVASFDLPNHGRLANAYGEGFPGMAAAVAAGQDVFALTAAIGHALADMLVAKYPDDGPLVVGGTSRGGLAALQVMAADSRFAGAVALAPVTNILVPREFSALTDSEIIRNGSALALVPKLRGRPTFMSITSNDERVGTPDCLAFQQALLGTDFGEDTHRLMIEPGEGHSASDAAYAAGAEWMLALIARTQQGR